MWDCRRATFIWGEGLEVASDQVGWRRSSGIERVVLGGLARLTPRRPRRPMSRFGGAPGYVTGIATFGSLRSAPHRVHFVCPRIG